ncbi:MAG: hypothetical protein Q9215_007233 [Flavoplaca cf. flavocitrina]
MLALFRHQFLFLLAVFNLIIVARSAAICYLPDGSVANKDDTVYQPCNATAAENGEGSACCDLGSSVCLSTGLCFGSDSYIYRGGCTDRRWSSGNCPSQCLDAQPDRYANIYPCGFNGEGGTYTQNFCCGGLRGSSLASCCDDTFFVRNGLGLPYVPPSSALALPDTRTSANESSDTVAPVAATSSPQAPPPASPSPTAPPSSSNTTAVAAGVAVPLGVMLIAALAFLAYRERQRKKLVEELVAEKTQILSNSGGSGGATANNVRAREVKGYYSQESPSELSTGGQEGRAELASTSGPFHEIGVMSPR